MLRRALPRALRGAGASRLLRFPCRLPSRCRRARRTGTYYSARGRWSRNPTSQLRPRPVRTTKAAVVRPRFAVDPWGVVVGDAGDAAPSLVTVDLDLDKLLDDNGQLEPPLLLPEPSLCGACRSRPPSSPSAAAARVLRGDPSRSGWTMDKVQIVRPRGHPRVTRIAPRVRALVPFCFPDTFLSLWCSCPTSLVDRRRTGLPMGQLLPLGSGVVRVRLRVLRRVGSRHLGVQSNLMKTPIAATGWRAMRQDFHAASFEGIWRIGSVQVEQMDISDQRLATTRTKGNASKMACVWKKHPSTCPCTFLLYNNNLRQVQFKVRNTRKFQNLGKNLVAMMKNPLRHAINTLPGPMTLPVAQVVRVDAGATLNDLREDRDNARGDGHGSRGACRVPRTYRRGIIEDWRIIRGPRDSASGAAELAS